MKRFIPNRWWNRAIEMFHFRSVVFSLLLGHRLSMCYAQIRDICLYLFVWIYVWYKYISWTRKRKQQDVTNKENIHVIVCGWFIFYIFFIFLVKRQSYQVSLYFSFSLCIFRCESMDVMSVCEWVYVTPSSTVLGTCSTKRTHYSFIFLICLFPDLSYTILMRLC